MEIKTFSEYQSEAIKTAKQFEEKNMALAYSVLGITGETGEVSEIIKKHIRGDGELDILKLKKEIGDVIWYIARLCDALEITMEECAQINILKLRKRHGETFTGHGNRETPETE